jgi:hypothetical protein
MMTQYAVSFAVKAQSDFVVLSAEPEIGGLGGAVALGVLKK